MRSFPSVRFRPKCVIRMPVARRQRMRGGALHYLPLHLDLRTRPCLVVGGGALALRKIELLLRAGAKVAVVAKEAGAEVRALAADGKLELQERAYAPADVYGRWLVVAATDDEGVNAQVFADCEAAGTFANTVDSPQLCSAIFPAIIDRGSVQASVSTGGRSPTLARTLRGWLEARLPPDAGALADFAAARRPRVKAALPNVRRRRQFWDLVLGGAVAERLLGGDEAGAEQAFAKALADAEAGAATGLVALVGAGPGDPELLTLRGLRLLQQADAVLYDNLVDARILDFARREAERIYVGRRASSQAAGTAQEPGQTTGEDARRTEAELRLAEPKDKDASQGGGRHPSGGRQAAINELLAARALQGECVVRLKGGDPFIFGRGGEEVETLAAKGIDCVVVPGITAALGAASYAGVPLTHRNLAESVRFVTGHRVDNAVNLDWPELINPQQTLVVYMGLLGLPLIAAKLIAQGLHPETPALLVEKATLPEQKEVQASIAALPEAVAKARVQGPTVIIIGEVVRLRR